MCKFFYSSRRRHTILQGDWSSDVCSSDLLVAGPAEVVDGGVGRGHEPVQLFPGGPPDIAGPDLVRARADRDPERVAVAISNDEIGRASCRGKEERGREAVRSRSCT